MYVSEESKGELLALAQAGQGRIRLHNAVGGRRDEYVEVNLFDPRTEFHDGEGHGTVFYGDPVKVSMYSAATQKRNVRVDGEDYFRLKAIFEVFDVTRLISPGLKPQ